MASEVSYRQVGREKGYVPPPRLKGDRAKLEAAGHERDAFGNRTERFSKPVVRRVEAYACVLVMLQHAQRLPCWELKVVPPCCTQGY